MDFFPHAEPPDTDIDDILRNKMSYEERLLRSSKLFFASQNLKAGMVYKVGVFVCIIGAIK